MNPSLRNGRRLLGCALLLLALPACYATGDTRVFVTSDPPGADIALEGQPTGQTTPAILQLDSVWPGDREVMLSKDGYDSETRKLVHHKIAYTSRWKDGANAVGGLPLPLWWTFGDIFAPFGTYWGYEPHELHVKLYKIGEFVEGEPEPEEPDDPDRIPAAERTPPRNGR